MPVRQSFAVEMVGREDISNVVALNSAMFNGARIVGPAIAGLTIGLVGVAAAFAINALSFLAVIVGLLAMRDAELRSPPRIDRPQSMGAVFAHLREGFDYVRSTPLVLLAVLVVGLVSTFGMNFGVVIPTLTQETLHSDAAGLRLPDGGVGRRVAPRRALARVRRRTRDRPDGRRCRRARRRRGPARASRGPIRSRCCSWSGSGSGRSPWRRRPTRRSSSPSPDRLRGRVMSFYTTIFAGSTPIGGLLMGGIASSLGIVVAMAVGGALSLAVGIGALVWIRRRALDRPLRPVTAAALNANVSGSFPEAGPTPLGTAVPTTRARRRPARH